MKKTIHFFLFFLLITYINYAQTPYFKKGDRVVFVGNSITNNGAFHHNIFQYYVTRFPEQPITFFNCGISGDVTAGILKRMDSDVLIHEPTHAVIMIGMNDVNRRLYGIAPTSDVDTLKKRELALEVYKINLDSIIRIFLSKGIKVIIQKPTIYDQTAVSITPNNLGVNDALKQCAEFGELLSKKYKLPSVDYWTILNDINNKLQLKEPSATIIGPDRVHPAAPGHLIMAFQFLKALQSPQYVSKIEISKNALKTQSAKINCVIDNIRKSRKSLSFSVKENALPFPINENQKQAVDLVPFKEEFNLQELKVSGLKKGNYQLKIDTSIISTFSAKQLKSGINLTNFSNTPQYRQAVAINKILVNLWQAEANLRTIKWVEISHLNELGNNENLSTVKDYLDKRFVDRFQNLSNASYYKGQFEKYLLIKSREKEFQEQMKQLSLEAYELAKPVVHHFTLSYILKK